MPGRFVLPSATSVSEPVVKPVGLLDTTPCPALNSLGRGFPTAPHGGGVGRGLESKEPVSKARLGRPRHRDDVVKHITQGGRPLSPNQSEPSIHSKIDNSVNSQQLFDLALNGFKKFFPLGAGNRRASLPVLPDKIIPFVQCSILARKNGRQIKTNFLK